MLQYVLAGNNNWPAFGNRIADQAVSLAHRGHDIKWTEFWGKWHKRFGRNRTEPIEHKANVQSYVTKYVMKSQQDKRNNHKEEVWWNVWLSRYRARMAGTRGSGFLR